MSKLSDGGLDEFAHPSRPQCRAHFWQSASRCEKSEGHEGAHSLAGFAIWGDDLSTFHDGVKPSGGLLDLLEDVTS